MGWKGQQGGLANNQTNLQINYKMHSQSIEAYQLSAIPTQKYSLRHRITHSKHRLQPSLPSTIPSPNLLTDQGISVANDHWTQTGGGSSPWERCQEDRQVLNCFQTAKRSVELNRFTSVTYLGNHRTASTTPSIEYQLVNPRFSQKSGARSDGNKYSLKNSKKSHGHKSNIRLFHDGVRHSSDQRFFTDNYSQPVSSEEHHSDHNKSEKDFSNKYSLKLKNKNTAKPQLLLNLKYTDLAHPLGRTSSIDPQLLAHKTALSRVGAKFMCSTSTVEEGCRCEPRCLWMERWLTQAGETKLPEECRGRGEKEWEAITRQIERDIPRTQPEHPTFNNPRMLNMLREVLVGYAQLDLEVGYVQGMNFVASAIVYHAHSSYDALRVLNYLMGPCGLRRLFLGDLSFGRRIAERLSDDLRRLSFDLHSYLINQGIEVEMFASSWYFSLCGSFVPLDAMHHFVDKFMRRGFAGINEMLVALMLKMKDKLMASEDTQLMLAFSNQKLCEMGVGTDWQDLRIRSDRILLPLIQL